MTQQLLMGNEAIALGAIRAGVQLVSGYPGTPSTEILESVAKHNDGSIYVEWSVNEKVALEVAAGAAFAGARTLVTMKQVGLNLASDPLMSLNYVGVKGGMVVVVADDPGPISSQTEQDTRHFGKYAKIAVFDPATPEEAYQMVADAFDLSERYGAPVLLRPTTRISHSCASVTLLPPLPQKKAEGFIKNSRWVIFPRLAYANHLKMEENLLAMSDELSSYHGNQLSGSGQKGIACGGINCGYVEESLCEQERECKVLKIGAYPFPEKLALRFLEGLDEVLVVEELDPVIEGELLALCGRHGLTTRILGKRSGHMPKAGENSADAVNHAIHAFLGDPLPPQQTPTPPALPVRPPVLCAGCPHRASFYAVKRATRGIKTVYTGDIGCYTLGNAQPLDMVDTCLCMGAGITVAQGIHRIEPDTLHIAFVGDATFFHTGISGIVNAVYNGTDLVVVILDNSTTAMTGNQPHPGTGLTMMGTEAPKLDIATVLRGLGVSEIVRADPLQQDQAIQAFESVMGSKGVRAVIYESPCIVLQAAEAPFTVDSERCIGCRICITQVGCPACSYEDKKVHIQSALCTGCALCATVCPKNAIGGAL